MILLIAVFLIVFIIAIVRAIYYKDLEELFAGFFLSLICAGFVAVIGMIIGRCLPNDEITYTETVTPIVALEDGHSSDDVFFLGSGCINDNLYYYYVTEDSRGYMVKKIKTSEAYVRYDETPRIETLTGRGFKHWYNYIWALPSKTFTTIYVPEGTILNNFNIDLK